MLKIQMIPRYTIAAASSRLRVFHLAAEMNRLGLAECRVGQDYYGSGWTPDVVYMQKLGSEDLVRGHERALYDYDDIWHPGLLNEAAGCIQAFTADTTGHGALAPKRCEIVPDMIDYEPTRPLPATAATDWLCWFGSYPNLESARRLLAAAAEFAMVKIISDSPDAGPFHWRRWAYESFPLSLQIAGTAFLSHACADPAKSANKMATAVTLGVPCIVQESPAYEELAHAAGLSEYIVRDAAELKQAWQRLQSQAERHRYLDAIQPIVWDLYRPERIARRFADVCNSL